jgi:hypothetical protein
MTPMRANMVGPPRRCHQDQRFHRGLSLRGLVLGLWKLCDVIAGIL